MYVLGSAYVFQWSVCRQGSRRWMEEGEEWKMKWETAWEEKSMEEKKWGDTAEGGGEVM